MRLGVEAAGKIWGKIFFVSISKFIFRVRTSRTTIDFTHLYTIRSTNFQGSWKARVLGWQDVVFQWYFRYDQPVEPSFEGARCGHLKNEAVSRQDPCCTTKSKKKPQVNQPFVP